jgi:uncharacterized protein YceK
MPNLILTQKLTMTKILIILSILISLGGCKSVGTQYNSPAKTEPHASIETNDEGVLITSFDKEGCYSGRTHLNPGEIFNLHPDKEVVITYEAEGVSARQPFTDSTTTFCRLVFSFTPIENEHYVFKAGSISSPRQKYPTSCTANLNKITQAGLAEPVNITQLKLSQKKLTCIRAVPMRK